jgi:hypothetical protein
MGCTLGCVPGLNQLPLDAVVVEDTLVARQTRLARGDVKAHRLVVALGLLLKGGKGVVTKGSVRKGKPQKTVKEKETKSN